MVGWFNGRVSCGWCRLREKTNSLGESVLLRGGGWKDNCPEATRLTPCVQGPGPYPNPLEGSGPEPILLVLMDQGLFGAFG